MRATSGRRQSRPARARTVSCAGTTANASPSQSDSNACTSIAASSSPISPIRRFRQIAAGTSILASPETTISTRSRTIHSARLVGVALDECRAVEEDAQPRPSDTSSRVEAYQRRRPASPAPGARGSGWDGSYARRCREQARTGEPFARTFHVRSGELGINGSRKHRYHPAVDAAPCPAGVRLDLTGQRLVEPDRELRHACMKAGMQAPVKNRQAERTRGLSRFPMPGKLGVRPRTQLAALP